MSTFTVRLDTKLKKEVQKLSDNIWISLNQLINLKLQEFIQTWEIHVNALTDCNLIEVNEPAEKVHDYLDKMIKNGKELA